MNMRRNLQNHKDEIKSSQLAKEVKKLLLFFIVVCSFSTVYSKNQLVTYPSPEGVLLKNDFTVKVRQDKGEWQHIPTYLVKVDKVEGTGHKTEGASMSYFDFSGVVEVSISYNNGAVNSTRVRPLSYKIEPIIQESTITFSLSQPRNLSVEINGDIFHNLHFFANPIDDFIPDNKDTSFIYFGAGVHHFEDNKFYVPSGKTVYIDGGAVLMGQVLIENVQDVKVLGRGMIDHSIKMGVHIANAQNVTVEGIFCTQCAVGGSNNVSIRNVKSISYFGWGDGMNVFASNNVFYDRIFCRNSDDCHTVYATRKGFTGGCKNITMQNSTLWADVAHPITIGIHGNTNNPDVIQNLKYVNIDILDHQEKQLDYQGCMAINAGDNNLIKDVLFEDIRVEDFREGQLVNLRIFYNKKYCTAPGLGIENITFRNITYKGDNANMSVISGYNKDRTIKNILFENLKINGSLIYDEMPNKPHWFKTSDMAQIFVGEHVEGVKFKKSND